MKKIILTAIAAYSVSAFSQDIINVSLCGANMSFDFIENYSKVQATVGGASGSYEDVIKKEMQGSTLVITYIAAGGNIINFAIDGDNSAALAINGDPKCDGYVINTIEK